MSFTDFPNGLDANVYLSPQHHANTGLRGSTADISRFVIKAEFDDILREIICSLLAGRGLKLPNIQICISLNLAELLGISALQATLSAALQRLSDSFTSFLDHMKIDQLLGRINGILAEVTNIANMINFCSTPIDPVAIPNLLEQGMQSLLGAGQSIVDSIGTMIPNEINTCLIDGQFNTSAFNGGILGNISANFAAISTGTADQSLIDSIVADIDATVNTITTLIADETGIDGSYDDGGSDFASEPREVNKGMGVLHNANDAGMQGNTRIAGQLKALYDNLGSYQVVANDGTVYNNIFELFVEPDLLSLLRRTTDPTPEISDRQPVYNYCGEITGYTQSFTQAPSSASTGDVPVAISEPGFNAGGLPTDPSTDTGGGTGGTVVNEITNIINTTGSSVLFADSEAAQLVLNTSQGDMVFRTDTGITYVDNGGTAGTIADFNIIGGGSLSAFLTNLDTNPGTGIMARTGDTGLYRTLTGTANQITITNGDGVAANPTFTIANNPIIPGTNSLRLPIGTTGQRVAGSGNIRFNTTTSLFEGYNGTSWDSFATGSGTVTDGANVGGQTEIYKQNNANTLEFRTLAVTGALTIGTAVDVITIGEVLTASNKGAGSQVFKQRLTNDLEYRTLVAGDNVTLTQNTDTIEITADLDLFTGTTTTTTTTVTEVLFNGGRIGPVSGDAWYFEAIAVAKRTNGVGVNSIKLEGILDNNAGIMSIAGTSANKTVYNNTVASNWDLTLDDSFGDFRVNVTGAAAMDIKWSVRIRFIKV